MCDYDIKLGDHGIIKFNAVVNRSYVVESEFGLDHAELEFNLTQRFSIKDDFAKFFYGNNQNLGASGTVEFQAGFKVSKIRRESKLSEDVRDLVILDEELELEVHLNHNRFAMDIPCSVIRVVSLPDANGEGLVIAVGEVKA